MLLTGRQGDGYPGVAAARGRQSKLARLALTLLAVATSAAAP